MSGRPAESEYAPFFAGYVSLVPEDDVLSVLEAQRVDVQSFARSVPPDQETLAYAPQKWTIRQVVGHVSDAERVFGYRAFCISRGEQTSLPGFDENQYVARSPAFECRLDELVQEFTM